MLAVRRRRLAIPLIVTALLAAPAAPASAAAYNIVGRAWPGDRITYADQAGRGYRTAIARAVKAWNDAGVGVRFEKVADPSKADIRFIVRSLPGCHGDAPVGSSSSTDLVVLSRRCLAKERPLMVAHEIGHVLGLGHVGGCRTMHNHFTFFNEQPSHPVPCRGRAIRRFATRLLTDDDIAGARRAHARPGPLAAFGARPVPGQPGTIDVIYDAPAAAGIELGRLCNRGLATLPRSVKATKAAAGRRTLRLTVGSGRHCFAAQTVNAYGRPGAVALAGPVELAPPIGITMFDPAGNRASLRHGPVELEAAPTRPLPADVGALRYEWDFGDPASGEANRTTSDRVAVVKHLYRSPGTYTVVLTVTHVPSGLASTATERVVVDP